MWILLLVQEGGWSDISSLRKRFCREAVNKFHNIFFMSDLDLVIRFGSPTQSHLDHAYLWSLSWLKPHSPSHCLALIKYKCPNTVNRCNRRISSKYHRCGCRYGLQFSTNETHGFEFSEFAGSAYNKWPHHAIKVEIVIHCSPASQESHLLPTRQRGHPQVKANSKLLISASH